MASNNFSSSVLAFLCMLTFWALTVDSAAEAPAVDCNNIILNLADCLSFVTNGSTVKKPEGTCCSGLKMVLKTDAQCLCEGFKNSAQLGVVLNVTKATALPDACHVSAPSVSNCGLSLDTGAAPALSPDAAAAAPSVTAGVPTASAGASEVTPAVSARPGSSGSTSIGLSIGTPTLIIVAAFFSWI